MKTAFLDGLRGIACLVVLTDHWFLMGYNDPTAKSTSVLWRAWLLRSPLRLFVDGGFAVAIFLVLSGYVLLIKFLKPENNSIRSLIYSGMARRYPRLMIPSFSALLIYFSWLHFGPWQGYSGCHAVGEIISEKSAVYFDIGDVVLNGVVGQWLFEEAIYTIEWTLQIELLGSYIIFIIALGIVQLSKTYKKFGYVLLVTLIPILDVAKMAPLPLQYLQSFITGMLVAELEVSGCLDLIRSLSGWDSTSFALLQSLLIAVGLYVGTVPYQITLGNAATSMWMPLMWLSPWIWLTTGAGCLIISLLTWKSFQTALSTQACLFIGRISFAIYLLHYQVLIITDILIMPYLGPALNRPGSNDRTAAAFICYFFIILPVTIVASYYFHIYVDETSIECSRDFVEIMRVYFPTCCNCLKADKREKSTALSQVLSDDAWIVVSPNDDIGTEDRLASSEGDREEIGVDDSVSNPLVDPNAACNSASNGLVPYSVDDCHSSKELLEHKQSSMAASANQQKGSFWQSKKMILVYVLLAVCIPCCIPSSKHTNCFVDDDA